ncbi:MAG TPA: capsule assembly Wzi family protein [Oligoflexia bacterium]|nr:capsule assembly Wzi family protein [Oligoflexia bacterium]HMR24453.1 capsule assembly Wzi family protein [Oligoflexia bacterium]
MKKATRLYPLLFLSYLFLVSSSYGQSFLANDDFRYILIKKYADMQPLPGFNLRGQHSYSEQTLNNLINSSSPDAKGYVFFPKGHLSNIYAQFSLNSGLFHSSIPDRAIIDIDATKNHLLDNSPFFDQDKKLHDGSNVFFDPYLHLSFANTLEINAGAYFNLNEQSKDFSMDLYNANILLKFSKLRILLGKSSIQWNLGRINSFNLSNNTPPLWAIRIFNDEEIEFSNFLKFLGPVKYETFISVLDANRNRENPIFVGHKLSFAPNKRLELGMSYTVQFAGKSTQDQNPLIYFGDVFSDYSGVSNRNFIFDARYQLFPKKVEAYAEFLVEDCCDNIPINARDFQSLLGLHIYQLFGTPKMDASFEFAKTSYIAYRHGNFKSGFINQNKVLGHPIGPDGLGSYAKLNYFWSKKLLCSVQAGFESSGTADFKNKFYGNTDPNVESSEHAYQTGLQCFWNQQNAANKALFSLNGNITYQHTQNYNYIENNNRDDVFVGLSGKYVF